LRDALVHPGLAVWSDHLYWSTEMTATIDGAPLAGGTPEPVVTSKGPHGRFAVLRGSFYWLVDGGSGSILFAGGPGGAGVNATEIANVGPSDPDLLAINEYTVYDYARAFVFGNGVELLRMGSGDAPQPLSGSCFYPTDLAADTAADTRSSTQYVYWSCQDGTLHWIPQIKAGAEHVEQHAGWGFIAPWGGFAYVTDVPGGRVLRASPTDGNVTVVHAGLADVTKVAVDDSGLYVGVGTSIRHFAL
jgi:hypothetical protein